MIPPDRIMYADFLRKKLAKSHSARGHALPYNGSQNLIVARRYKDGKAPALLWVGALKGREEDDVVEFLQEAAFELGLLDTKELWFMHSDRAPELKGKKVRRFLVRNDAVPLRGASNRSTTHSREEAFVKRALRYESDASELGAERQVLAACGTHLHREHELEALYSRFEAQRRTSPRHRTHRHGGDA